MKAEDLVEALNIHMIQTRRSNNIESKGHLVLQRNIQENSVFKAYKTYLYTLWFVVNRKKYKVFTVSLTNKVLDGQEEGMIKDMDNRLCISLFELLDTEYYKQILKDEYYGNADQ